jgi:hypothetical protein
MRAPQVDEADFSIRRGRQLCARAGGSRRRGHRVTQSRPLLAGPIPSVPWSLHHDNLSMSAHAEAIIAAVQEATEGADLATKIGIGDLRTEVKAEIADLRSELRQVELRLEAKIEAMKGDILNRMFGLVLGMLVVNIIAIVGAIFAVAKLLGH